MGGTHTLIVTFTNPLNTANVAIASGIASFATTPVITGDTMTISLSGVADAQVVDLQFSGVTDFFGQSIATSDLRAGFLVGDVNGDGSVNAADATSARNASGQTAAGSNFRSDCNADGSINSADAAIVRGHSGNGLPTEVVAASEH
jgi:hypothetical protein